MTRIDIGNSFEALRMLQRLVPSDNESYVWRKNLREKIDNEMAAEAEFEAKMQTMTDSELHAIGAHPDYNYYTTEGQRKSWDEVDTPPGESWERNTDMGSNGWERFDYTEESYWRRKKEDKNAT